jgi:hypothetical protein
MKKKDVQDIMVGEHFDARAYSLEDERKNEALCLRNENGRWCVYYSERGLQTGKQFFEDEHSACEYFLIRMRSDPTTKEGWKSGFSMTERGITLD